MAVTSNKNNAHLKYNTYCHNHERKQRLPLTRREIPILKSPSLEQKGAIYLEGSHVENINMLQSYCKSQKAKYTHTQSTVITPPAQCGEQLIGMYI